MFSDRVRVRLQDIIDNADWVDEYLDGFDVARFMADRRTRDAVERCLERIAEAVSQIGAETIAELDLPAPFSEVRGLGNRLRHEYRRIDRRVIYDTARCDLPPLREAARRALES